MFQQTNTYLDKILAHKQMELRRLWEAEGENLDGGMALQAMVEQKAHEAPPARDFLGALRQEHVALIAEVKKASPSKGVLIEDFDPVQIGKVYDSHGAAAISVLTDEQFFQGHLRYMRDVRENVGIPVLRKDFIIDGYQVDEARASLADAVLLIVAALDDAQLKDLYMRITGLGMQALVEVHSEDELDRAMKLGAAIIGVNNRNLRTFEVDLAITERLAKLIPEDVVLVAESGISSVEDVRRMGDAGANAILVGEALVRQRDSGQDVGDMITAFTEVSRLQRS